MIEGNWTDGEITVRYFAWWDYRYQPPKLVTPDFDAIQREHRRRKRGSSAMTADTNTAEHGKSEIEERVALAIREVVGTINGDEALDAARAAIAAMREPTDAMCRANSEDGGPGADEHVRQDWRAMIDAAIGAPQR